MLCSAACLKRMLGILRCALKFVFNITWKKQMSPEAPIESLKVFPIL